MDIKDHSSYSGILVQPPPICVCYHRSDSLTQTHGFLDIQTHGQIIAVSRLSLLTAVVHIFLPRATISRKNGMFSVVCVCVSYWKFFFFFLQILSVKLSAEFYQSNMYICNHFALNNIFESFYIRLKQVPRFCSYNRVKRDAYLDEKLI